MQMDPGSLLPVLAEISVALLGFAAVVSIFHGARSDWKPDGRFWSMMMIAMVALSGSLLPLPFIAGDIAEESVWKWSGSAVGVAMLSVLVSMLRLNRTNRKAGVPTNFLVLAMFIGLILMSVCVALYNSWVAEHPEFSLYLAALVLCQIVTAGLFVRLFTVWLTEGPQ